MILTLKDEETGDIIGTKEDKVPDVFTTMEFEGDLYRVKNVIQEDENNYSIIVNIQ